MDIVAGLASASHELVAGIWNERSSSVTYKGDGGLSKPGNDLGSLLVAGMVIISAHRDPSPNVLEQLARHTRVFRERFDRHCATCRQREATDPRDFQWVLRQCAIQVAGGHSSAPINSFPFNRKRDDSCRLLIEYSGRWIDDWDHSRSGDRSFVFSGFDRCADRIVSGCLREAATKASDEKVTGDNIEAYLKNACTAQSAALREALIAFRLKNGMT